MYPMELQMTKEVGYRIRIDEVLRQRFIDACRQEDRSAAQVVREFMRSYVNRHLDSAQGDLFVEERRERRENKTGER